MCCNDDAREEINVAISIDNQQPLRKLEAIEKPGMLVGEKIMITD